MRSPAARQYLVGDHGADWDLQDHVLAGMTAAIRAFAVSPAIGFEFAIVSVAQQRVVVRVGFQKNAAAMAAVAPGRSAARHIFFAAERDAAIAAVSRFHINLCFIDKHGDPASASYCNTRNGLCGSRLQPRRSGT